MARDRMYVNGLRLPALIGVLPQEREAPQPVQVDLEMEIDLTRAGATDDLEHTAHYGEIAEAVARVVHESSDLLLERLVARIAECVLGFPLVESVTATLTKLHPPIPLDVQSTAVCITRTRVGAPADVGAGGAHRAVIALGSNLGDRAAHLRHGLDRLGLVVAVSQVFETDPVGGPDNQGPYLNMVAVVDTDLDPFALLRHLQGIEAEAQRVRLERWGPRTLDLDLLFYDDAVITTADLVVPHPRVAERRFVLEPLSEVAPDLCPPRWRDTLPAAGVHPRGPLP